MYTIRSCELSVSVLLGASVSFAALKDIPVHTGFMRKTKEVLKIGALVALGSAALISLVACEKEGPAEKAGKKIDEAVEEAGDKVEDATD
ncbi:hypothetical protein Rhal01_00991 [Rubritalea halochordaticola]|uniref:YtxH domain-containing protein n=2 Tax=Rubritalea halochordaticola TaxID=714537 RepID=A0ABP9V2H6_9BACT